MSVLIMSEVWKSAPFDGYTLLALLALADSANDEGVCWPSIPVLMQKTRQPRRTVYQAIKNLSRAGWLERCEVSTKAGKTIRAYRISAGGAASANCTGDACESFVSSSVPTPLAVLRVQNAPASASGRVHPSAQPAQESAYPAHPEKPESAHGAQRSAQPAQKSAYPAQPPYPHKGGTVIEPSVEPSGQLTLRVVSIAKGSSSKAPSQADHGRFILPEWVDQRAWAEYEAMRKRIKAPLTPGARERNLRELACLREQGFSPTAVLQQSVDKCWKGVFKLASGPTAAAVVPQGRYRECDFAQA